MRRRTFLKICGAVTLSPLIKYTPGVMADSSSTGMDNVLVILELLGGNDGLNTVIPFTDPEYYNARGALAVSQNSILPISDSFGLHPEMEALIKPWEAGKIAIVNGTGYSGHNLSHFRSTDIWRGATTVQTISSGWLGRYLEYCYPDFQDERPSDPPGIEVKGSSTLLMKGDLSLMGMAVTDPDTLYEITQGLVNLSETEAQDTNAGRELLFTRELSNQSAQYAEKIYGSYNQAENSREYPPSDLSLELALIARLIAGGLSTQVYSVAIDGFDTHANQLQDHPRLLRTVSDSVAAFLDDIEEMGIEKRVVLATTSEFGRRVQNNGSGTDHGTAAPLMLFGAPVSGGFYGSQPSLKDLDDSGNMKHAVDFRQIYSSLLEQWMGLSASDTAGILNGKFETIPLIPI